MMAAGRRSNTLRTACWNLLAGHTDLGAVGLHVDGHRIGHADGVGDLHLDLVGKAGGHDVLGHPACRIGRGTIPPCGSLPENAPPPWWAAPP